MKNKLKVGVLVSGWGSNMEALIRAQANPDFHAEVVVVISNKADAPALEKAAHAHIPHHVVKFAKGEPKEKGEQAILDILNKYQVELVVLAGFMRIVSPFLVSHFKNRMINIHPSLLPAFPGLEVQKQALKAGVKESGCTVHFVDEGCDTGPIIAQAKVPILTGDTVEALSKRILVEEHKILPKVVNLIAQGKVKVESRVVKIAD